MFQYYGPFLLQKFFKIILFKYKNKITVDVTRERTFPDVGGADMIGNMNIE